METDTATQNTGIDDVGNLPFFLVRPILSRIENPANLRTIEKNCPQIAGEDAELWIDYIRRDFGDQALEKYRPENPESWSKVYRKLKREQDEKDQQDFNKLKEDMAKAAAKREKRRVAVIPFNPKDRAEMRRLDRGFSGGGRPWNMGMSGTASGRVSKPGPFKSGTLNKVLTRGMRRG
ncbi:Elongin-A [Orbilia brochopaga]|nr:Elongin-A [Drechslerella brochopaga]